MERISEEKSNPGDTIEKCANECNNRHMCTGFEYNQKGDANYECHTYTNGLENILPDLQHPNWTSCIKGRPKQ